ncbi:hypothetical protein L210DRAFT_3521621, partial [Boletus edulis BED1]
MKLERPSKPARRGIAGTRVTTIPSQGEQEICESESVVEIASQGEQPRSSSESTVEIPSQGAPGKSDSELEGDVSDGSSSSSPRTERDAPSRTVVPVISLLTLTLVGELVWYIGTSLTSCLPTRSTMSKNESTPEGLRSGTEGVSTRFQIAGWENLGTYTILTSSSRPWWKHLATKTRATATKKLPVPRRYWDISGVPCPVES